MKKVLKIFLCINAIALFLLNIAMQLNVINSDKLKLTIKAERALADECENQATCYSTYHEPLIGGTTIWVCGSCVQVKAKDFSDSGICYFE